MSPQFSSGADERKLSEELDALLKEGWTLDEEQMGLKKTFYFKTYTKVLDFSQMVGIRSKSKDHHSTMTLKAGSVLIHWTTHVPRGLSAKDVYMAQYCDKQASEIGMVGQSEANKCAPRPDPPGI